MDDEQNYYITPPTLFLPESGLRITVIGTNEEWAEKLADNLENTFSAIPMTFYHLDDATADQWQWLYYMAESSDLIMVNVGECTPLEFNIGLLAHQGNRVWFYVDIEDVDKDIRILLNSINANVFNNDDQLYAMLRNFVGE